MTPADLATANAIHFEGVKHAYRQTKDGVVISFVVHPHDVPKGLAEAPLGSRYIVALVQVGDDEQPIHQPAKETSSTTPATPEVAHKPPAKREKMDWRDMLPSAQAAMLCDKAFFRAFLADQYPDEWRESMTEADECVRLICGVSSRSQLNNNPHGGSNPHRVIWHQLNSQYDLWMIKDRVGV